MKKITQEMMEGPHYEIELHMKDGSIIEYQDFLDRRMYGEAINAAKDMMQRDSRVTGYEIWYYPDAMDTPTFMASDGTLNEERNKLVKVRIDYQGDSQWYLKPEYNKKGSQIRKGERFFRGTDDEFRKFLQKCKVSDTDSEPASKRNKKYADIVQDMKQNKKTYVWMYLNRWNGSNRMESKQITERKSADELFQMGKEAINNLVHDGKVTDRWADYEKEALMYYYAGEDIDRLKDKYEDYVDMMDESTNQNQKEKTMRKTKKNQIKEIDSGEKFFFYQRHDVDAENIYGDSVYVPRGIYRVYYIGNDNAYYLHPADQSYDNRYDHWVFPIEWFKDGEYFGGGYFIKDKDDVPPSFRTFIPDNISVPESKKQETTQITVPKNVVIPGTDIMLERGDRLEVEEVSRYNVSVRNQKKESTMRRKNEAVLQRPEEIEKALKRAFRQEMDIEEMDVEIEEFGATCYIVESEDGSASNGEREWKVFTSQDDAERYAREEVEEMLRDDPTMFEQNFLIQHIYITDVDRRMIAVDESNDYSNEVLNWQDALEEADMMDDYNELDDEVNELIDERTELEQEKVNIDINDDDRFDEIEDRLSDIETRLEEIYRQQEQLIDEAREAVNEQKYDEVYDALEDPVQYFVEDMGMFTMEDLFEQTFIQINAEEAAQEAVNIDGVPHFLDSYDGEEEVITDSESGQEFYVYGTN